MIDTMSKPISILVADDEHLVRKGIKHLLAAETDYRIIGEAENGQEVLDKVKFIKPHVLILDVRMPVIDGLDALENIQKNYPEVKTIILSGYSDFHLAKRAMKLGALDYLLKPCNLIELREALERTKLLILKEQNERDKEEELKKQNGQYISAFWEKFYWQLLKNELLPSEIKDRLEINNIKANEAVVISATIQNQYHLKSSMTASNYKKFCYMVRESIQDTLGRERLDLAPVLQNEEEIFIIIIYSLEKNFLPLLTRRLRDSLKKRFAYEFVVAFSEPVEISNLAKGYQDTIMHLRQKLFLADSKQTKKDIILPLIKVFPEEKKRQFLRSLRYGDEVKVFEKITELFNTMGNYHLSPSQYSQLVFYITETAFQAAIDEGVIVPDNLSPFVQGKEIEKLNTRSDLFLWLKNYLRDIITCIRENHLGPSIAVKKSITYLDEHFKKKVNLTTLANHVGMSSSYLSCLIKKETGKNFSEHLTERRLSEARRLLAQGNLNISEVAFQLGYDNPRYFSDLFSKYEGIPPGHYRKRNLSEKIKKTKNN